MGDSVSKSEGGEGDLVEAVVCKADDLKDGEMREVAVEGKKALLVREEGQFYAIGNKCTHFGAPLAKGSYSKGHVRCPWHGACFNVKTGDIEDFPGLDSIHKFEVIVEAGNVKIKASLKALENFRLTKDMACSGGGDNRTFLIVGGGGASEACAETLRQEGFQGKLILATKDNSRPYDRTLLSKKLDAKPEGIALRKDTDFYKGCNIDLRCNKEAVNVDTEKNVVTFKDGDSITYDKLLLATGGSPRTLDIPGGDLKNICLLRTPEEANYIGQNTEGKDVVIIGTSYIGTELAATLQGKAKSVTLVGRSETPFEPTLGKQIGTLFRKLHEDKGTKFVAKNPPKEFKGENGKLKEVILEDGTSLPADICIMGVGVFPTTAFLKDSGMEIDSRGYIPVDKHMKTNKPNVYAAGDIVTFPLFTVGDQRANVQHWQMAHAHGRTAAFSMVDKPCEIKSVPYFWTMQFGKSIRYTGYGFGFDDIIVDGDPDDLKFVAYYTKGDEVIAVASMNSDPIVSQAADMMYAGKKITKQEVTADPTGWIARLKS